MKNFTQQQAPEAATTNLRFFFITASSFISGKEIVTLQVARILRQAGCRIFFMLNNWSDGRFAAQITEEGFEHAAAKLGWVYFRKLRWTLDSLWHWPRAYSTVRRKLKDEKPDYIYVDSYRQVLLFFPLLKKYPVIYHVHDASGNTGAERKFMHWAARYVHRYLAVSAFIRSDLEQIGMDPSKITVLHNAVDIPDSIRHPELTNDVYQLGIVGQVIEKKGHDVLLRACQLLKAKAIPFRLHIFGNSATEYGRRLRELAKELELEQEVIWAGFQTNKSEIYSRIHVLIAPTQQEEPFGLVAAEAMAYEVPVIASRSGGFLETVADQETGLLIDGSDPRAIEAAINMYVQNPEMLQQHGKQGRSRVIRYFSSNRLKQDLYSLLQISQ